MPERKLSFCMVTTFYPPYHFGGDAMQVYRLSTELAKRGHRVTVVHSVDAYKVLAGSEPRSDLPKQEGVEVVPMRSALGPIAPLTTYLSGRPALNAPALRRLFERERFDVVHFHNVSLVGGPGVLRYGDGVKLYTMNEHWLVCPMHVLWKYNRRPCEKPDCLRCTLSFRRPPQLWRYTGLLERQLDQVQLFLSPSRFTLDKHRERGFTRPIRHLPHFLARTDAMAPAEGPSGAPLGAESGRPYFLFVGRLEKLKGVQTLIKAFRNYDRADLVIAGAGTYADELAQQARGLAHVRFVGRVGPAELHGLYSGALALLVPSVGYEVFGIVILEAFAYRTPVIVHDLGALPELVADSDGGFTYRTDDELVAAMETLRERPSLRQELGDRGHDAWLRLWSEEPHLDGYFASIEEAQGVPTR